jgi:hypothetical protein
MILLSMASYYDTFYDDISSHHEHFHHKRNVFLEWQSNNNAKLNDSANTNKKLVETSAKTEEQGSRGVECGAGGGGSVGGTRTR